eukprot:3172867-Prymnesium_polylepis.1
MTMGWCYNPTRRARFAATPTRPCTRSLDLAPRPSTHLSSLQRVGRRLPSSARPTRMTSPSSRTTPPLSVSGRIRYRETLEYS